ncbi:MAG: hypothetical protein P4L95_05495 [Rouxiella aceris]|uniref:hypothetical protein n=1 Tax=Rouxiella aceris TaxID=2703884 RepID=UPI00283C43E0|nr:hypothetical protein [Rouxiella aceris]MDR3431350.1 hypothetical protein [Rouxiella aceris]
MKDIVHTDRAVADAYYLQLPIGRPTQGDIWTNLPFGTAPEENRNAVIITPRCDFAHGKSPVLNYLPIISLSEYVLTVGGFSLIAESAADTRDALRKQADILGIKGLMDMDMPLDELNRAVHRIIAPSETRAQQRFNTSKCEFEKQSAKIARAEALLTHNQITMAELKAFTNRKRFDRLQRDLIRNNSLDTYFLPPCQSLIEQPSLVLL